MSALKKTNLDKLLEAIHLQAEILELKANPDRAAEGTVIEAKLDKGRGPLATVLVQRGTLKVGDVIVVGAASGKVRAMLDDHGKPVKEAGPSVPVEVLGLGAVPSAGDQLTVVENEARAREVATYRQSVLDKKRTTIGAGQPREHVRQPRLDHHRVPAGHQGRRPGLGRSDRQRGQQDLDRRDQGPRAQFGRRRDHRERRHARDLDRRADHRLQRPPQRQGARSRQPDQGRVPLLRRHLPPHRLGEAGDGGRARARDHRDGRRPRRGPGSVPGGQEGQGRRPARPRRQSSARASTPASPARM